MSEQPKRIDQAAAEDEHTFTEQIEIAGSELVDRTKEVIAEGNVRRLIVRNQDDEVLLEVPLTMGVAVGGVVTLIAPVLAASGAMAALLTHVKVEIVRAKPSEGDEGGSRVTGCVVEKTAPARLEKYTAKGGWRWRRSSISRKNGSICITRRPSKPLYWISPTGPSLWLTARISQHFTRVRLSLGGTASYVRCWSRAHGSNSKA